MSWWQPRDASLTALSSVSLLPQLSNHWQKHTLAPALPHSPQLPLLSPSPLPVPVQRACAPAEEARRTSMEGGRDGVPLTRSLASHRQEESGHSEQRAGREQESWRAGELGSRRGEGMAQPEHGSMHLVRCMPLHPLHSPWRCL